MPLFRLILVAIILIVGGYTIPVLANYGWNFMPFYLADIAKMGWAGQFNVDFGAFLLLGSIWLMWRHHFTPLGLLFGLVIFAGGAPFLCGYLLIASLQTKGDVKALLLGSKRAAA